MNAKVLIIEDEKELGELVQLFLEKDGISSVLCSTAEEGLELLKGGSVDLIILDINLPGMDGFEFLQIFRKRSTTGVLILSAREADEDVVLGLGLGADEFVTKPFAPKVLVARVRALLRRLKTPGESSTGIGFGKYVLHPEGYALYKEGERIVLSTKEFDVLRFLVMNPGKVFMSSEIYSAVWNQTYGDITSVAVYIQRLRKKIERDPSNPEFILTIRGKGYLFDKDGA